MEGDRKYVRVYYSIIGDERFEKVYPEPKVLGTWLQLLLLADAIYPADAALPGYVNRASLRVLVDAGLVVERPHGHYAIHGLASEREMRSRSGRIGAAMRWQSGTNASKAEQSIDKQSRADASRLPPFGDVVKGFPK